MSSAKGFVLDSSTALAWCFPDEHAPYPHSVLDSLATEPAFVPSLWALEIANALLMGERRGRSAPADTIRWTTFLQSLPIAIDDETTDRAWSDTLDLARIQNLSAYDAAYLELALRHGLPLATLDAKLKAAALAAGVPLYQVTP